MVRNLVFKPKIPASNHTKKVLGSEIYKGLSDLTSVYLFKKYHSRTKELGICVTQVFVSLKKP